MRETSPRIAAWLAALTLSLSFEAAVASNTKLPDPPTRGTASWYGAECAGKAMANGKPFDPAALTCASWFYPLGTKLEVRCGNRSVIVECSDRGPARRLVAKGRIIDLSRAAFEQLGDIRNGILQVNIKTK